MEDWEVRFLAIMEIGKTVFIMVNRDKESRYEIPMRFSDDKMKPGNVFRLGGDHETGNKCGFAG
jgi:hypothetical protein